MQASTSRTGTRLAASTRTRRSFLPCTCQYGSSSEPPSLVDVLRKQQERAFALGGKTPESPRSPKSQRARLLNADKRRSVLVRNLSPSTTLGDIRRLAISRVKNQKCVLESTSSFLKSLRCCAKGHVQLSNCRPRVHRRYQILATRLAQSSSSTAHIPLPNSYRTRMPHLRPALRINCSDACPSI